MEPQSLNAMHEHFYSVVMMMIQYITLVILGSASLPFIIICLVGVVSDYVEEMTRPARRLPEPLESPELHAHNVRAALADLDYGLTGGPANREMASSTQRA